ncbi:neprilysin-2-like [Ornithodoros turicata]|uniref:neprilysin-2-like n=1 Tax=Ornithodoros turicata TaxID=34597 RepID=UPI0031388048
MAGSESFIVVQDARASSWESEEEHTGSAKFSKACAVLGLIWFSVLVVGISVALWIFLKREQRTTDEVYTPVSPGQVTIRKVSSKPGPPVANYGDYEDSNVTGRTTALTEEICDSDDCRYVRQFIEGIIDTDRDPCDNFYAFTCGKNEQLRKSGVYVDPLDRDVGTRDLQEAIQKNLDNAHIPDHGRTAFQQSAALYRHCGEADRNTSAKVASDFLAQHQMNIREDMFFDPLDVMVRFIFEINIPLLFTLEPEETGSPNFTLRQIAKDPLLGYVSVDEIMSGLFLAPANDDLVQRITQVEQKISNMSSTASTVSNGSNALNVFNLGKLGSENGDDALSKAWTEALERYSSSRPIQNMRISITEADFRFFHALFGKQSVISKNELRLLLAWRCTVYLFTIAVYKTEWCIGTISQAMSVAAGSTTVFPLVDEARINGAREMVDRIIEEIKESLRTCSWLDDETRSGALQKISKLRIRLGYPPKLNTAKKVDAFYRDLPDLNGPFVLDYLKVNEFHTKMDWKGVAAGYTDYYYEVATPLNQNEANGYNAQGANIISIFVPYLLKPHFSLEAPAEINYGRLGFVVTHEVMHCYDHRGRLRDGDGALSPWFTRKSLAEYMVLERCYVEHIDSAPKARAFADYPGEYQADAFGIMSLLRAYQKAARESKVHLGNVKGMTRDQLFYVALCLQWCAHELVQYEEATHPPWDERCNVPLMNSVHFSKTFACRPDSPMNPPQKCLFW